jgi:hypothetical protein
MASEVPLDEVARRSVDTLLVDGPQAQEVWGVVLEVLGGMVAQATAAGWPPDIARRMVSAQFIANLEANR